MQGYSGSTTSGYSNVADAMIAATGVEEIDNLIPNSYKLSQNYPNPFNPTTNIEFSIPNSEYVSIKVYDVLGNVVADLANQNFAAGNYSVDFNASSLTSGIYIYSITAGNFISTKKMMLIK